jgi:hypothetical protein
MLKVIGCLDSIVPIVDAAAKGDEDSVRRVAADIKRLELEADSVKKTIRAQLTKSLLATVSRSEILALVKAQDDVADQCERVSYELSLRRTAFPAFIIDDAKALAAGVAAAAKPLGQVSRMLDESAARPDINPAAKAAPLLDEIEALVAKTENQRDTLLRRLFDREGEVPAIDLIFLLRFAEGAQKVSSKAENVADVLLRLIAETGK